jgi:hypothetical protein
MKIFRGRKSYIFGKDTPVAYLYVVSMFLLLCWRLIQAIRISSTADPTSGIPEAYDFVMEETVRRAEHSKNYQM